MKDRLHRESPRGPEDRSGSRILIVDDELSILELVKAALETIDNDHVDIASSAADALELIYDTDMPFDCVVLDVQMPDMDGLELLRRIRDLPEYSETPVVMLTAMSEGEYVENAYCSGASDYVRKPFDFHELHSRIKCAYAPAKSHAGRLRDGI